MLAASRAASAAQRASARRSRCARRACCSASGARDEAAGVSVSVGELKQVGAQASAPRRHPPHTPHLGHPIALARCGSVAQRGGKTPGGAADCAAWGARAAGLDACAALHAPQGLVRGPTPSPFDYVLARGAKNGLKTQKLAQNARQGRACEALVARRGRACWTGGARSFGARAPLASVARCVVSEGAAATRVEWRCVERGSRRESCWRYEVGIAAASMTPRCSPGSQFRALDRLCSMQVCSQSIGNHAVGARPRPWNLCRAAKLLPRPRPVA